MVLQSGRTISTCGLYHPHIRWWLQCVFAKYIRTNKSDCPLINTISFSRIASAGRMWLRMKLCSLCSTKCCQFLNHRLYNTRTNTSLYCHMLLLGIVTEQPETEWLSFVRNHWSLTRMVVGWYDFVAVSDKVKQENDAFGAKHSDLYIVLDGAELVEGELVLELLLDMVEIANQTQTLITTSILRCSWPKVNETAQV